MKNIPEIQFEEIVGKEGNLGLITLTRQQALNALNHAMFIALNQQLTEWDKASHIKAVVIRAAEGRAFCAGGDIRHAYELRKQNDSEIKNFFRDEYQMNKRIHHFSKPYIALLNGITMGGGVGISLHGSHRIATENVVFSMPETSIGFYPDVGTTYYLSRMKSYIGYYLALTGARINAEDCKAIDIVQEIVPATHLQSIINELAASAISNKSVSEIIRKFSVVAGDSKLLEHKNEIQDCFAKNTVEDIIHALEKHSSEWCRKTAEIIKTKSPTSLKVTLKALQEAAKLNFDECMKMEFRLTSRFVEEHDFFEGVRAAIIDKDQSPKWQPSSLADVTLSEVEKYFSPLEKELA